MCSHLHEPLCLPFNRNLVAFVVGQLFSQAAGGSGAFLQLLCPNLASQRAFAPGPIESLRLIK